MKEVELAGERVTLDAERALVWEGAVVVADTHFGKEASARAAAIPVPDGHTIDDLARLDVLLARHSARELWLLGDVFDSRHARDSETLGAIAAWRERHAKLAVRMVAGNHDRRALGLAERVAFQILPDLAAIGPWRLSHHPVEVDHGHVLCGHVHPGLGLRGPARERLKVPAFILGIRRTILPAFGGMTGLALCRLDGGERAYVVASGEVVGPVMRTRRSRFAPDAAETDGRRDQAG